MGRMPVPYQIHQATAVNGFRMQSTPLPVLPERYDAREHGRVSPVKNQAPYGTCWSFGGLSALEGSLLPLEMHDFSENHLVWNTGVDRVNLNSGGSSAYNWAYMLSWAGSVDETDAPYNGEDISGELFEVQKHVQNAEWIIHGADFTDNTALKQAIMQYGAVDSAVFCDPLQEGTLEYAGYHTVELNNLFPVTLSLNDKSISKTFEISLFDNRNRFNVRKVRELLDFERIKGENSSLDTINNDLNLISEFEYQDETYRIRWFSSNLEIIDLNGEVYPYNEEDSAQLIARIKGPYYDSANKSFDFTVPAAEDNTPPAVVSIEPENGSANQEVDQFICLTFNEPVYVVDYAAITIQENGEEQDHYEVPQLMEDEALDITLNLTIADTAVQPYIEFSPDENHQVVLPAMNVTAPQSQLGISAGTIITPPAESNWEGTFHFPEIKSSTSIPVAGTLSRIIEIGLNDTALKLDKAARLLIPGQAGRDVACIQNGQLTPIIHVMSEDTQEAGDVLAEGTEGKIDVGQDLVIWTKHFTEFVVYAPVSHLSGGGGGSSSSAGAVRISSSGGEIDSPGVCVSIPEGALTASTRVKIQKADVPSSDDLDEGRLLIGDVFDIQKDQDAEFNVPVTIILEYDPDVVNLYRYKLTLCWYDKEKKEWVALSECTMNKENHTVSGKITHFTPFGIIASLRQDFDNTAAELSDIEGHWAQNNIQGMLVRGEISGYPDQTFRPNKTITRAEFVSMLVKAFSLQGTVQNTFADTSGHWAESSIAAAQNAGIVSGYDAEHFGPDNLITREQMMVMLIKASKLSAAYSSVDFADAQEISTWAVPYLSTALDQEIIKGYPGNLLKPKKEATRAEAVTVIAKVIGIVDANTENQHIKAGAKSRITLKENPTTGGSISVLKQGHGDRLFVPL
ncbi:MAG: S-layer homology domain-containing protein [Bacillota bacterium]|nr:S-layer homology domain-containing protein [Bacillota bacterium]